MNFRNNESLKEVHPNNFTYILQNTVRATGMHKKIEIQKHLQISRFPFLQKKLEFTRIYKYPISIPVFQGVGEQLSLASPWKKQRDDNR